MSYKRRRPPTDLAWRIRNWFWYGSVRRTTGLSDQALDLAFLAEAKGRERESGELTKFFNRLRWIGCDPCLPRQDLGGMSVFDRVHATTQWDLSAAKADFESDLWKVLADPTHRLEDLDPIARKIIRKNGWHRETQRDSQLAGLVGANWDHAFATSPNAGHVFSAMVQAIEQKPCADSVALLIALFKEALAAIELDRAQLMLTSLFTCVRAWGENVATAGSDAPSLLERMVERRVLREDWRVFSPSENDPSQHRYIRAVVTDYLRPVDRDEFQPIVLRSPLIQWVDDHRPELERAWRLVVASRDSCYLSRRDFPWSPEKAHEAHLKRTDAIADDLPTPPPFDSRFCLPFVPQQPYHASSLRPPGYLQDGTLEDGSEPPGKITDEHW